MSTKDWPPTNPLHKKVYEVAGLCKSDQHQSVEIYCAWRYMIDFDSWYQSPKLTAVAAIEKMRDLVVNDCNKRIADIKDIEL